MMPEEWPVAARAAEASAPPRVAAHGRLATVRRDFFLDPAERLTEQERALMTAMLHGLVGDVADAIRAALPNGRYAANDEGNLALTKALTAAGLLDEPELIALLLRRADEERIAVAAKARAGRREARVLQGLVSYDDAAVAAAAMALILARGRRRDRFGQCVVTFDDLSRESAETLANAVAAAVRPELLPGRSASEADFELTQAVERVLSGRDPERSVAALTAGLVDCLDEAGALTDEIILAAANEGEIEFLAHVLAKRAEVPSDAALEELLSGDAHSVIGLLRMAGMSRALAAGLLAALGDLLGIADAGEAIALFERVTDQQAAAARSWLLSSPAYRAALERLGQGRG
jgi:hypothetical protein